MRKKDGEAECEEWFKGCLWLGAQTGFRLTLYQCYRDFSQGRIFNLGHVINKRRSSEFWNPGRLVNLKVYPA